MDQLPPEIAQYAEEFLAPGLVACVYAAVAAVGASGRVSRAHLPKVAAALGLVLGAAFGLAPYAGPMPFISSCLAGLVIGLAAPGVRELTRKR